MFYACFDDFEWVGGMLHCFKMARAKEVVEYRLGRGETPIFGSTDVNPEPNTGVGYPVPPRNYYDAKDDLHARSFVLSSTGGTGSVATRAINVVKQMQNEWGNRWRDATIKEQLRGMDIVNLDPPDDRFLASLRGKIEIKGRSEHQAHHGVFLQTHEVNLARRHD